MRSLSVVLVCALALSPGCSSSDSESGGGSVGTGAGPYASGRFTHGIINETSAPWDGMATHIFLTEKPIPKERIAGPGVLIMIYSAPESLSYQRKQLTGGNWRECVADWVEHDGKATPLESVELTFQEVQEGKPVGGSYRIRFADGRRELGDFRLEWRPSDLRGRSR